MDADCTIVPGPHRLMLQGEYEGNVELREDLPKGIVLRLVVEEVCFAIRPGMLKKTQHNAVEAKILDAQVKLLASLNRIMHLQAGKSSQEVSVLLDLLCDPVVRHSRCLRLGLVRNALSPGTVKEITVHPMPCSLDDWRRTPVRSWAWRM